ncbi:MAG: dihydroneopterin aldolase family protein [Archaeoglobus sp.]|nr:dihydroneopterin aldolase family protein [Archaeoglobus sp.]
MVGEKEREKAAFEAGIKLGALFHQFIGTPVSFENVEILEKAMESCVKLQPFVADVKVKINREKLKEKLSSFNYTSLTGEMLEAWVKVEVEGEAVSAHLRWDEEKRYPLMSLE